LQPPLELKPVSHVLNASFTAAWLVQAAIVVFVAQFTTTAGAFVTVKLELQVLGPSQELVTVYVTLVVPPQMLGATGLPYEALRSQPPLELKPVSHALNAALTAAWDEQAAKVVGVGQEIDTDVAAVTVKLAEQVDVPQVFDTLKITVVLPPHLLGAPELLFVIVPPLALAVASQVA
jgi:hypothetical protein